MTINMITVTITEPTEYMDRSYQTASWWEKTLLTPGTYEVVPWSNLPYYFHFAVPATIIEDYFASSFAGANVQPYDRTKHAGDHTEKWIDFIPRYYHEDTKASTDYEEHNPTFRINWHAKDLTSA